MDIFMSHLQKIRFMVVSFWFNRITHVLPCPRLRRHPSFLYIPLNLQNRVLCVDYTKRVVDKHRRFEASTEENYYTVYCTPPLTCHLTAEVLIYFNKKTGRS